MRAKQVTALMMAATLAVTSNGVTALAAPAADAATESAAVAEVTEEEVEETEDVVKSAASNESNIVVDADATSKTVTYGETVDITATVNMENYSNKDKTTLDEYVLYECESDSVKESDTVLEKNATGKFTITPKTGKRYAVRAYYKVAGQASKVYGEKVLDEITVNDVVINSGKLHVPDVTTITLNKADTTVAANDTDEVKNALKAANTADEAYKDGSDGWECTSSEALKTGKNTLTFKFTAGDNYQVHDDSDTDATQKDKEYTKTVDVTVVQLATEITINNATDETNLDEDISNLDLTTGGKATLKAVVSPTTEDHAVTNSKVVWTSSDPSKVKVTTDEKDNAAVITAVAKTGTEGVKITATSADGATNENGAVKKEITVVVKDGINADDIYFDAKLPEITYNGTGDLSDYYEDYLEALNAKTTIGEYSFGDGKDTDVSTLKSKSDASETTKDALKIVFTLKDDTLTTVDSTKKDGLTWDASNKTLTKSYDVTVNKQTISSDASAVIGTLKSSYVAGTSINDILSGKNSTDFTITVQKTTDGGKTWSDIDDGDLATTIPTVGKLSNYRVKYKLESGAENLYTLSGADKDGYKYVSLASVSISQPTLEAKAVETSAANKSSDKYRAGETLTLDASYTEDKLGTEYYDVTYQWYKLNSETKKYEKVTDNVTGGKLNKTVEAADAGTYYCEVTATIKTDKNVTDFLPDATTAQKKEFATLIEETNKITVDVTGVKFEAETVSNATPTYGSTADVTASAKVTAEGVTGYRVYYRPVITAADKTKTEGAAVEITSKKADDDLTFRFKNGNVISEKLGDLDAGEYNVYIEVSTASETTYVKAGTVTVAQKELTGLDAKKLSVAELTYGKGFNEATITYADKEIDGALDFAFVDNSLAKVGKYTAMDVKVSVADKNYKTDTTSLKADVTVVKAPLTVKADNVSVEQGNKAELTGTIEGLVGDDKVAATYTVVDANGKEVADTSKLAVGTYKIKANVAEQANYEVTTEDGILTVSDKKIAITGVSVNASALTLKVGESKVVAATVAPANTTESKYIKWTSDNTAVANVATDGTIYALKAGTANITATASNGMTATVKVTVKAETSVKVSTSKVTLTAIGASKTVTATVQNADNKTVTWSTSNKKVATVDKNGKIVAKGNGKATITVKTADGKKATVKVTVKQATKKVVLKVGKKVVTGKTYTLKKGKTATVKATVTDAKGKKVTSGNQKITWTTSNKKVATISKSGKITAKKAGTVKITAKTADGKKVTFKVKVK